MYFIFHPISSLNHLIARLATDQITFLASIILFVLLSKGFKSHFWQSIDKTVANWAQESKGGFLRKNAEDFAMFGNAVFHILFALLFSIILFLVKHKLSIVLSVLFVLIFSWGLNRILKIIYKRTRPHHIDAGIRRRMSYCFPSGHVMASISLYFFSALILQGMVSFVPWYLVALIISCFVVMSRIYLHHHYFTDVLGGIAMGIFCLNVSIWFYFFTGLL